MSAYERPHGMLVPPFIIKIAYCPLKTYLHNNLILADCELLSVQKNLIGPHCCSYQSGIGRGRSECNKYVNVSEHSLIFKNSNAASDEVDKHLS